jgi:prevent-host-death family protein
MGRVVSATKARIHLGELMRQAVESQEPIIIERSGKSHVVILSVANYERLLDGQQQESWRELVNEARAAIAADLGGRELPPPEEILQRTREARDAQLLALR